MEKLRLFGLAFWNASGEAEVVAAITGPERSQLFAKDNINFLITPNAYDIAQYHTRYKNIFQFFQQSGVVLADGMPIVWLSKLYKGSLKKRLTGSNLFPILWQQIKTAGTKAFFILPNRDIGERLRQEHPHTQYIVPDFFDEHDDAYIERFLHQHIDQIRSFQPDYIFIGITLPKQQKIAMQLHNLLSNKVNFNALIAILGASFEFYFGLKKRAPVVFQRTGTEWLYRFWQEPKRTWKRYTVGNVVFLGIVIRELFKRT